MKISKNKILWDKWEIMAIAYLQSLWHKIIDVNIRIWTWEIDIISYENKNNLYHFIEVKTRSNNSYWEIEESISYSKQKKFMGSVYVYLSRNNLNEDMAQIDVIFIKWNKINYLEAVEF